jgi:hypothetical protein
MRLRCTTAEEIVALAASVATWFLAIWLIGTLGAPGLTSMPRRDCWRWRFCSSS